MSNIRKFVLTFDGENYIHTKEGDRIVHDISGIKPDLNEKSTVEDTNEEDANETATYKSRREELNFLSTKKDLTSDERARIRELSKTFGQRLKDAVRNFFTSEERERHKLMQQILYLIDTTQATNIKFEIDDLKKNNPNHRKFIDNFYKNMASTNVRGGSLTRKHRNKSMRCSKKYRE